MFCQEMPYRICGFPTSECNDIKDRNGV